MKQNIIKITDFNAPQLDIYARLSEGQLLNRHEPQNSMFIAESPKVITVKIPMSNVVDSLNVAAAGAVAFWQLGKRH